VIEAHEIETIIRIARHLLAERRKYEKRSDGRNRAVTPKQSQKLNVDLNWAAMEISKIETQLHVACVDAGLADVREASHYDERHYHPSGWHHYTWTPPMPNALKKRLPA
jgi:hypothetical protein